MSDVTKWICSNCYEQHSWEDEHCRCTRRPSMKENPKFAKGDWCEVVYGLHQDFSICIHDVAAMRGGFKYWPSGYPWVWFKEDQLRKAPTT